jgi:hypothetical protein
MVFDFGISLGDIEQSKAKRANKPSGHRLIAGRNSKFASQLASCFLKFPWPSPDDPID